METPLAGYIQAKSLPYIGSWIQFSLDIISNLCNNSIEQPQPMVSTPKQEFSKWTMPMSHLNGHIQCYNPMETPLAGYIQAKSLPYIGSWIQFSLDIISNLCNNSIEQPQPMVSTPKQEFSKWTMPMSHLNGHIQCYNVILFLQYLLFTNIL
ncbi:hypothetical protein Glove_97g12 [Diversispora epigaea]|uniref:Uncharacterized protein n=1 Tax=Diversispora epigaea TaxID=1348612 RepID=A0A397J958_9GLOM|nr:hypothetical protein Glove_97g12 [Diversispora epigaea]